MVRGVLQAPPDQLAAHVDHLADVLAAIFGASALLNGQATRLETMTAACRLLEVRLLRPLIPTAHASYPLSSPTLLCESTIHPTFCTPTSRQP